MFAWLLAACAPTEQEDSSVPETCSPVVVPEPDGHTTLAVTVVSDAPLAQPTELNPALPDGLASAQAAGLGGWSEGPGEPWTLRDELAPGHPAAAGPDRRSLAFFAHQSDAQIADAESPTRLVLADAVGATQAAARPQELYALHLLDAAVAVVDAVNAVVPVDFWLSTGDNADSVQANELRWFVDTLDGARVHPDAGIDDTQLDEDCNDPIAPFEARGLDIPWYVVAGNHDVLVQGNFDPAAWVDTVLADAAPNGTRDLGEPGGPITYVTEPDPGRQLLDRAGIAASFLDSVGQPPGHGFTEANVAEDSVTWTASPVPGIRVISVDANPAGPSDGELSAVERDTVLIPALDAATAAGELIVVTSHYALGDLPMEDGGHLGDVLTRYPNVVLTIAGHWHTNRIAAYGDPGDPGAFWEIQTAATADWPAQIRFVELVANGDGTLSIYTTMADLPAEPGTTWARGRELSLIDWQSGWRTDEGTGGPADRNAELVQVLPEGWPEGWIGAGSGVRSTSLR